MGLILASKVKTCFPPGFVLNLQPACLLQASTMITNHICSDYMAKCIQLEVFLHDFPGKNLFMTIGDSQLLLKSGIEFCHGWKPKNMVVPCPSVCFLDTLFFVIPKNTF